MQFDAWILDERGLKCNFKLGENALPQTAPRCEAKYINSKSKQLLVN